MILQPPAPLHLIPPDLILPRILVKNSHPQPILNGICRLLQFTVCVAPISCQTFRLTCFVTLSGAWPHHVRSSVPTTRGLVEHPHSQHPHLPPHAYLSHAAFYSPIPHPGMLYPYIAPHPYPPPPASLPDPPSRKRAGPEETQSSRNKRKRSNAREAVESEQGSCGMCTWLTCCPF